MKTNQKKPKPHPLVFPILRTPKKRSTLFCEATAPFTKFTATAKKATFGAVDPPPASFRVDPPGTSTGRGAGVQCSGCHSPCGSSPKAHFRPRLRKTTRRLRARRTISTQLLVPGTSECCFDLSAGETFFFGGCLLLLFCGGGFKRKLSGGIPKAQEASAKAPNHPAFLWAKTPKQLLGMNELRVLRVSFTSNWWLGKAVSFLVREAILFAAPFEGKRGHHPPIGWLSGWDFGVAFPICLSRNWRATNPSYRPKNALG